MEYPAFIAGGLRCEFEHGMRAIEYTPPIFLGERFLQSSGASRRGRRGLVSEIGACTGI